MKADDLWEAVCAEAESAALDTSKFSDEHRQLIDHLADFLSNQPSIKPDNVPSGFLAKLFAKEEATESSVPSPIILFGEPGTGKTTFLYVIDRVLREQYGLPDTVSSTMEKPNGRSTPVQKRQFNGHTLSLLSVRQWADLLHHFAWDRSQHKFDEAAEQQFIDDVLHPMRIIFADEVEMTGYSPTLPTLARRGLLVVGTSNQVAFRQLAQADLTPTLYDFSGLDMRKGNPNDAIVTADSPAWSLFDTVQSHPSKTYETLAYTDSLHESIRLVQTDFANAMTAPLLEKEWLSLLSNQEPSQPTLLLLDNFALSTLTTNFNAILRFVSLFDAVEQLGTGVLVRNETQVPTLSRESLQLMETLVWNRTGVSDEIKQRVVAGIGRCISRLGSAGYRAKLVLNS